MANDIPDPVEEIIALAQRFQRENGGFIPFGQLCERGERKYQAADDGNEHPDATRVVAMLEEVYRDKARGGQLQWAVLCMDIHITDARVCPGGSDAIQVDFEDRAGHSMSVFVPYNVHADGMLDYSNAFVRDRPVSWF